MWTAIIAAEHDEGRTPAFPMVIFHSLGMGAALPRTIARFGGAPKKNSPRQGPLGLIELLLRVLRRGVPVLGVDDEAQPYEIPHTLLKLKSFADPPWTDAKNCQGRSPAQEETR